MATIPKDINEALPVISEILKISDEENGLRQSFEISFKDLKQKLQESERFPVFGENLDQKIQTAIAWLLKEKRIIVKGVAPNIVIVILPMPRGKRR